MREETLQLAKTFFDLYAVEGGEVVEGEGEERFHDVVRICGSNVPSPGLWLPFVYLRTNPKEEVVGRTMRPVRPFILNTTLPQRTSSYQRIH